MNKLQIIGRLTKDPTTRTTPSGKTVCNFTVAVNGRKTQTNQDPPAEFFECSAWEKNGEIAQRYLKKGNQVYVSGPVSARAYQASDGTLRAAIGIKSVEYFEFLSPKSDPSTEVSQRDEQPAVEQATSHFEEVGLQEDELPF